MEPHESQKNNLYRKIHNHLNEEVTYRIEKRTFQYTFEIGLASITYNELKNNIKKIRNSVKI